MMRKVGLLVILALALASPSWAQVQSGSILVKVVDDQGAVVPGVTVTLTSPVLPRPLVGVTDSAGVQRFNALTIGTYAIKTTLEGFQTKVGSLVEGGQRESGPVRAGGGGQRQQYEREDEECAGERAGRGDAGTDRRDVREHQIRRDAPAQQRAAHDPAGQPCGTSACAARTQVQGGWQHGSGAADPRGLQRLAPRGPHVSLEGHRW
jgi:hypothetical protein